MPEEGDVKKIGNEWFMYVEDMCCEKCEDFVPVGWLNIDKAVKTIIQLNDKRGKSNGKRQKN